MEYHRLLHITRKRILRYQLSFGIYSFSENQLKSIEIDFNAHPTIYAILQLLDEYTHEVNEKYHMNTVHIVRVFYLFYAEFKGF